MRRLFIGTTLALFVLAIPSFAQAQRGRTSSGQGGSPRGGFGASSSAHGGSASGSGNGFSHQGYSGSFGSFGHSGGVASGSFGGGAGSMDVFSQDFSRGFDPQSFSSANGNFDSYSSLGMSDHSQHSLGTTKTTMTSASSSGRSTYSSLGMGYQTSNSRGTNSAATNSTFGSGRTSSSSPGISSQSLNPVGATNSTSTQQGTGTSPTPLSVLTSPPQGSLGNKAEIEVLVPATNAIVSINGSPVTSNGGMTRYLETPNLTPGGTYSYTVTVSWQSGTQTMTQSQRVQVTPGAMSVANFAQSSNTSN